MKLAPQGNVLLAYAAGVLATFALHYAKKIGYDVPGDIADGLPFAIAVGLAHLCDIMTSRNNAIKAPLPPLPPQNNAA